MNNRGMTHSLLTKLSQENYFSAWLIFGLDMVISACSSLMVLLLCNLFTFSSFSLAFSAWWLLGSAVTSAVMFLALHTYQSIVRHSTLREIGKLGFAACGKSLLMGVLSFLFVRMSGFMLVWLSLLDFLFTFVALVLERVTMVAVYEMICGRISQRNSIQRILVYGTSEKSTSQVVRLKNSKHYKVVGFLTYGKRQKGHTLLGIRVYYFETDQDLCILRDRYGINGVLFAYHTDAQAEQERLLRYCPKCRLQTLISPTIDKIYNGKLPRQIRQINVEDLLSRPEIEISLDKVKSIFSGKTILITGAAGSIGSELCRQLLQFDIRKLVMFDNAETPLHNLRLEIEQKYPVLRFAPIIGDVRIPERLDFVFRKYRPQIVFHAAAYKHVPLMEENPCEAVLVNVIGSRNMADKCIEYGVERMVMISTDKAVNPTSVMGCTKRIAEIYVQSLGLAMEKGEVQGKTKFITTRFGNVLGSNGSVIPRFREQIECGGPVTVTHPDITRFFMTIPEACRLVMEAATISAGNEICVFDMGEPVKITHLAEMMIKLCDLEVGKDIRIEYTGLSPGEKLYEEVLATEENTLPTSHEKIRIAKVREYGYDDAKKAVEELERLSREVRIPETVGLMKRLVPEYRLENSRFKTE